VQKCTFENLPLEERGKTNKMPHCEIEIFPKVRRPKLEYLIKENKNLTLDEGQHDQR
jgi:hypothetical protein